MSCEYCKKENRLGICSDVNLGNGYDLHIGITLNRYLYVQSSMIGTVIPLTSIGQAYIPINFCPMCGSKLGDSDE